MPRQARLLNPAGCCKAVRDFEVSVHLLEFELELFPIASDSRIRPRPDAFGQDIALTLIYLSVWQELRGYIRSRANRQSEQFGRRGRRIYKERSQSTSTTVYVFRQTVVVTMFTATRGQFRRFLLGRRLNHCCM